jgi:hypothetical protein
MAEIICKQCGKPVRDQAKHIGIWDRTTYEITVRRWECTPDGTGIVNNLDAGTFCSPECLLRYLIKHTRVGGRLTELRDLLAEADNILPVLSDEIVRLDPTAAEDYADMSISLRRGLDKAWAALERAIDGDPDPVEEAKPDA